MSADPIDVLATVLSQTQAVVDTTTPAQADLPTPCPDWTVRDLVGHLLVDHDNFRLRGGRPAGLDTGACGSRNELERCLSRRRRRAAGGMALSSS